MRRGPARPAAAALAATGVCLLAPAAASADSPPNARIVLRPAAPVSVGQVVRFVDRSQDDGLIVRREWDVNGDGVYEERLDRPSFQRAFLAPQCTYVGLRVTDNGGNASHAVAKLHVLQPGVLTTCADPPPPPPPILNSAPRAVFSFAPGSPVVGQTVSFVSGATDPEGPIGAQEWDLDGDGAFNDASGPTAQLAYATTGPRAVSLRVFDEAGVVSVASQLLTVVAPGATPVPPEPIPPQPPGPPPPNPDPDPDDNDVLGDRDRSPTPQLSPVVVRIRGEASRRSVRVRRLSVFAPRGSTIMVRCKGSSCPSPEASAQATSVRREVRFRRFERRLRVGTVIRVMVTRSGRIGKYTRFALVRDRAPARADLCLRHGATKPIRCPEDAG